MATPLTDITARFEPAVDAETEAAQRRTHLAQQVAAVRRRSRRIKTLRTVLPALIIGIALLNVGWIAVTGILGSLNPFVPQGREIRAINPRYSGLSGSGSPFTISGLEAIQQGNDLTRVNLKGPAIDFKGEGDKSTHISSANGVYDANRGLFHLTGNVVMRSGGSDMTFRTEAAVINLKDLTISGDKRIEGTGSMGHIVGESFMISKNGADVVFRGRGDSKVWTTLNRK
ncbi:MULTISPECIES: LPS export ABC transporter periplasmic protein LptC [Asticcacaulis]|uniref:LPS export ABC transporter periplasmic protein LptC n=1 Tax=Asticcacaulis TaxID=76890 RepID=UPI001AEB2501|nr:MULTISPECIES: LPS export ABC transporter periplasmic protein LptC [Asticcacaulis]MBP2159970.1 lipopolysaccharide export system protein LptC [Asticcacaulis solisilvae]MDR6801015.1 lipopolysaccharide export system protein LptC [Asticcacaulis sp. BE141]